MTDQTPDREASHGARAEQMAASLEAAGRAAGMEPAELSALDGAYRLAMGPRIRFLDDDHHPAYLHPGRSPLILFRDVGGVDVTVLVVAALHESMDPDLRPTRDEIEGALGPRAAELIATVPLPGDERLAERLVTLGPGVGLAVLAERLDQLRHLHLRKDKVDSWASTHEEVVSIWLPFAHRVHPKLAVRYAHWARTFARRI